RRVIATSPLPTLCCSTNSTFAAFSAASQASTAATIPLVSINPIASPFAMMTPKCVHLRCDRFTLVCVQDCFSLSRDDQFLIRRDDPDFGARFDFADLGLLAARLVFRVIQHDPGPFQVAADR